jgi:hypothetical protein
MRHANSYANCDSNSYPYTDGNANSDANADANADSHSNSYAYTDGDSDRDTYTDSNSYSYGDGYGYGNTDGNSHSAAEASTDAEAISDTAATSLALVENLKAGTRERKLASSPPAVAGDYSGSPVACEVAPVSCLPTKHPPPVAAATYGEAGAE